MRKVIKYLATSYLILFSLLLNAQQVEVEKAVSFISKELLLQTTGYLSSKKFKGRLQGSVEYDQAARYVALRLKEIGLLPVNQKSMLHYFNDENNIIQNASLKLIDGNNQVQKTFALGDDFVCRGFTGSGDVKAEVVFCGYGVSSKDYDDFKDIDAKNKIVLAFKAAPAWKNGNDGWGDTSPRGKARIAKQHGAVALILVNQPNELPQRALIGSVACGDKPHLPDFPMIQIGNNVVDILFDGASKTFSDLYSDIIKSKSPQSITLKTRLRIAINAGYTEVKPTANVVAKIEGTDNKLKDEYVVLGAHLDHVGYQENVIFPGANDNASGVAALVEIANAIKQSGIKFRRSLLFVIFSSEESGLRGSKEFVTNSPIPTEKMVAMLNFDCVGQGDSIALGGKLSFPQLYNIAKEKDSKYTKLLSINTFGGGGADAEAFYKAEVPTLYFNTSNGYKYLHIPSDRVETLNPDMFEKLTKLGLLTISEIANGNYTREKDALKSNKSN